MDYCLQELERDRIPPPPGINDNFGYSTAKMSIRPSPIQGDGVFLVRKLSKGELFGFYEGVRCDHKGPYVMSIFARNFDGAPDALGRVSLYAMINEDLCSSWRSLQGTKRHKDW